MNAMKCSIGGTLICGEERYYECASATCDFVVCSECPQYGSLRCMMTQTRTARFRTLNKLQRHQIWKQFTVNAQEAIDKFTRDSDYWDGTKVLTEKEWTAVYWMDIGIQLRWLLKIRHAMFEAKRAEIQKCLQYSFVVNDVMQMICSIGSRSTSGCFVDHDSNGKKYRS